MVKPAPSDDVTLAAGLVTAAYFTRVLSAMKRGHWGRWISVPAEMKPVLQQVFGGIQEQYPHVRILWHGVSDDAYRMGWYLNLNDAQLVQQLWYGTPVPADLCQEHTAAAGAPVPVEGGISMLFLPIDAEDNLGPDFESVNTPPVDFLQLE